MNGPNKVKAVYSLLLILSIISIVLFLLIPFYRWKCADDFLFLNELKLNSVYEISLERYFQWDAKFAMPFFLIWLTLVKYVGFNALLPLASVSFILCSLIIMKIFRTQYNLTFNKSDNIILISILNICLWLSLYNIHKDTLYWLSGSVYIHVILFALIWLHIYLKNLKGKKGSHFSFYIFTLFISTTFQNISLGLLVLVAIDLLRDFQIQGYQNSLNIKKDKLILFIIFFAGILISTVSPGSIKQYSLMHGSNYSSYIDHNLLEYIVHFLKLNIDAIVPNGIYLLLFTVLFIVILNYFSKNQILNIRFFNFYNNSLFRNLYKLKWFIVAFCSLMIYWPTLLLGKRYYIGLYFYLFLAISFVILDNIEIIKNSKRNVFLILFSFFILNYGIYRLWGTLEDNYLANTFMNNREELLLKNKGVKKIFVETLDFNSFTRTARSPEIDTDPNYYINLNYSTFYSIDSIIGKEVITKSDLIQRYLNK